LALVRPAQGSVHQGCALFESGIPPCRPPKFRALYSRRQGLPKHCSRPLMVGKPGAMGTGTPAPSKELRLHPRFLASDGYRLVRHDAGCLPETTTGTVLLRLGMQPLMPSAAG